jgi:hypothetical protein
MSDPVGLDAHEDSPPPPSTVVDSALITAASGGPPKQFYSVDQVTINAELHQVVADAMNAVSGLRLNFSEEVKALKDATEAAVKRSVDALTAFEREIKPGHPIVTSNVELATSAQLELQPPFLDTYTTSNDHVQASIQRSIETFRALQASPQGSPSVSQVLPGKEPVDAASQSSVQPPPGGAVREGSPTSVVGACIAPILAELRSDRTRVSRRAELTAELRRWRAEVLPLGDAGCCDAVGTTVELELADPLRVLRAELAKDAQALAALDAELHKTSEERNAALRAEDVAAVESYSQTAVEQYIDMLGRTRARVKLATDAAHDVEEFAGEVAAVQAKANAALHETQSNTAELKRSVNADLDRLSAWHDDLREAANKDHTAFKERTATSAKDMGRCEHEERDLWAQLQAIVTKLETVHQRKVELVQQRMGDVEAQRIRQATYAARTQAFVDHANTLDAVRNTVKGAEEMAAGSRTGPTGPSRPSSARRGPASRTRPSSRSACATTTRTCASCASRRTSCTAPSGAEPTYRACSAPSSSR